MDRGTVTEFQQADGVQDWRALDAGASAWFDAPSMTAGSALVRRIGELTAATGLPDVDLRPGGVRAGRTAPIQHLITTWVTGLKRSPLRHDLPAPAPRHPEPRPASR